MKAVTVKFKKKAPAFLAVRKNLHPDLAVLFVYNADGNLVFQTAKIAKVPIQPSLATVPSDEPGVERLLVGSPMGYGSVVIEYSLAQHHNSAKAFGFRCQVIVGVMKEECAVFLQIPKLIPRMRILKIIH